MGALAPSRLEASSRERVILKDPQSTEREKGKFPHQTNPATKARTLSPESFWFPQEEAQRCAQDLPQGQQPATAG